jgi:hypothetical protein
MLSSLVIVLLSLSSAIPASQRQPDATFEVISGSATPENEQAFAKIRAWLWRHWEEHDHGSLVMITHTLEGERAITNFEIGRNDSGAWHIVAHTERELKDSRYPGQVFHESSESDCFSLVRIRTHHNTSIPKPIPDSEVLDADKYRLVFRSKDGKLIFDL